MKKLLCLALAGLAAGCTASGPPDPEAARRSAAELAAALDGYEQSGPPVSCVQLRDLGGNRSAGDAIVFDGRTRATLYVNRPPGGCPSLDFGRALVTHTTATQLCRGDIADVVDPVSGAHYGGCGLGDFVPYQRAASR